MQKVNKKEVSIDEDFKISSWESVSGACHIQHFMRGNLSLADDWHIKVVFQR